MNAPHSHASTDLTDPAIAPVARKRGRPRVAAPKQSVHLRLSPKIVEYFKAEGSKGWQIRLAAALETLIDKAKD